MWQSSMNLAIKFNKLSRFKLTKLLLKKYG